MVVFCGVVSTVISQQMYPGFEFSCVYMQTHVLTVSAWVLSGFSGFLSQSMHVRSPDICWVSTCRDGESVWLSVSMLALWWTGDLTRGYPRLWINDSWDRFQPPWDPELDKQRITDGWMARKKARNGHHLIVR